MSEQEQAVELIARTICAVKGYDPDLVIDDAGSKQWQTFTKLARSTHVSWNTRLTSPQQTIPREPTGDMIKAGSTLSVKCSLVWRAMYDAAPPRQDEQEARELLAQEYDRQAAKNKAKGHPEAAERVRQWAAEVRAGQRDVLYAIPAIQRALSTPATGDEVREALTPFAKVIKALDYWSPEAMPNWSYPVEGTRLELALADCPAAIGALTEQDFRRAADLHARLSPSNQQPRGE